MIEPNDPLGAFVPGPRLVLEGNPAGPLAGLNFAVKDNYNIAGLTTGAGSPDWARTHPPAIRTAIAVQRLLDAGARLIGKTQMDPLAWGSLGINEHYGAPKNPAASGRIVGGSSSGSASAVAGGAADFALGTDSACSVRLPAALCGIFGLRPTYGRTPLDGIVPLSPSLDTVGWFARSPEIMTRIGAVLLDLDLDSARAPHLKRLVVADDVSALAEPATRAALEPAIQRAKALFGEVAHAPLVPEGGESLNMHWFRVWGVQIREVWAQHGVWIHEVKPNSKILSRERFKVGADSTPEQMGEARAHWARWCGLVRALVGEDGVLCLPTVSEPAPLATDPEAITRFAKATMNLMSLAVVAGLPQITLPVARVNGSPVGLSLIGPPSCDEALLALAGQLSGN